MCVGLGVCVLVVCVFCVLFEFRVCVLLLKHVRVCDCLDICVLDRVCVCLCVLMFFVVVVFFCARVSFVCMCCVSLCLLVLRVVVLCVF